MFLYNALPCPCPDGIVDLSCPFAPLEDVLDVFLCGLWMAFVLFLLRCVDIDFIPFCVLGIPHVCDPSLLWRRKPFFLVVLQRRLIVIYHPFYT